MLVSCLTLLNSQGSSAYYATSLVPAYAVLLVSVVIAVRGAGRSAEGLKLNRESKKIQLLVCARTHFQICNIIHTKTNNQDMASLSRELTRSSLRPPAFLPSRCSPLMSRWPPHY